MKPLSIQWRTTARLSPDSLSSYQKKLAQIITSLSQTRSTGYQTPAGSINLPYDDHYYQTITDLIAAKKKLNPAAIVLIGIGGSSLGTLAVWQASKLYNETVGPEFFCVETVDPDTTATIVARIDTLLSQEKPVLIIVASKSGTTTETVANFLIFEHLLRRYHPHRFHEFVVAITDKDSALWQYAAPHHYDLLEVPQKVGGRYSVLSAVGLFPLGMLGIDIDAFRRGAQNVIPACLQSVIEENPAVIMAAFLHYHYQKGIAISDLFLFSTHLLALGNWYRQLIGESLGKPQLTDQSKRIGITPTVSIGTNDLHSMAQLYLGGPVARCTTFVTVEQYRYTLTIPQEPSKNNIGTAVQHKSLATIMNAIVEGVQTTYAKKQLPFITIPLPDTSAESLGQHMQYSMIMMIYLGALFEVNPFDQPHVELYKEETRKILNHE